MGFAATYTYRTGAGSFTGVLVYRLTALGHDFLDLSRDNSHWKSIKDKIMKVSAPIAMQLLIAEAKQKLGL